MVSGMGKKKAFSTKPTKATPHLPTKEGWTNFTSTAEKFHTVWPYEESQETMVETNSVLYIMYTHLKCDKVYRYQ